MDIKEANKTIRGIIQSCKFKNIYCRLEPFNKDIYLRISQVNRISPGSKTVGGPGGVHFDGLRTVETVASFRMVNAKRKDGRSIFRNNYIRIYTDRKGKGVLKLIVDHDISIVSFDSLGAY